MKYLGFIVVLFAGCATQPPASLRVEAPVTLRVVQVAQSPEIYQGKKVRWGGVIYKTINLKTETEIEVIAKELDKSARPKVDDQSAGRFMVRVHGFLEPSIYAPNREITVVGVVAGRTSGLIGEFEYQYPIIKAESYYLWEERPDQDYYDRYWMYDPWYWGPPWYPWWYYY